MRRVWPWLVMVLMVLGVLHPFVGTDDSAAGASGSDPTTVSRFDATYALDDSGDLVVTETIEVQFPDGEERHGIFRFFDERDPNEPRADRTPRLKVVTRDGEGEKYEWSTEGAGRHHVLKIGDGDVTLEPGTHTYVIRYEIDGVLLEGDEGDDVSGSTFYWNVVPGGSLMAIDRARVTLRFPVEPGAVECGVGTGAFDGCTVAGQGTSTVVVSADDLDPGTPMTVRIGLPGVERSTDALLPWSLTWSQVLGTQWWYVALVAALVLYAGWLGHRLASRTDEAPVGAPLQYAPPPGVGPYQATYTSTERITRQAFVASLLLAAQVGAVTLARDGKDWTVRGTGADVELDPVTTRVLRELGVHEGGEFVVEHKDEGTGAKLAAVLSAAAEETKRWSKEAGVLEKSGPGVLGAVGVVAAFVAYAALVSVGVPSTSVALVPGAFAAFGLPMLYLGSTTRRTEQGRQLWAQADGFRRVLATPSSKDRFDFSGRQDLYTAYLPWAVAFGCADAWTKKYRVETGQEPPQPDYLVGVGAAGAASFASSFVDSFDSPVKGAISAHQASQSDSGGSSGGSGGGGGGGGMGSW